MAENDIELSVGVKLDEAQFTNEYSSFLNKTAAATKTQIDSAFDSMSGPATKNWGELPFFGMHDSHEGNKYATQAFLASLSRDLKASGMDTSRSSLSYQSALINAAYRSSIPDPMQRFHMLQSQGLMQEADLTHPDTSLGKAIETDYALMSQPWSRDFIKTTKVRGEKRSYIDFAGMRDYAVDAGLGRWIDEEGGNTADNFELINDELDKIEDKSKSSEKLFLSWGEALKGVLGTLTAIGAVAGIAAKINAVSERGTIEAGTTLDRRRALIGMSAIEEVRTKVASKSIGLGEDSIKNEIYNLSETRERFKMFGQGDVLPQALLGVFDALTSTDTPYDAYVQSADQLYEALKNEPDDNARSRILMLMNRANLGSMSSLVGAFLSNPKLAEKYGTPSKLFELESNPFRNVYENAEVILPDLTKLNESISASYKTLELEWEKQFGKPFKDWWNSTLQTTIVPWATRLMRIFSGEATPEDTANVFVASFPAKVGAAQTNRNMQLTNMDKDTAKAFTKIADAQEKALGKVEGKHAANSTLPNIFPEDPFTFTGLALGKAISVNAVWKDITKFAGNYDKQLQQITDPVARRDVWDTGRKAAYMVDKLRETGLYRILENGTYDAADQYILRAIQLGEQTPIRNGNFDEFYKNFDASIDALLNLTNPNKDILDKLTEIASNTEALNILKNDPQAVSALESVWGKEKTQSFFTLGSKSTNRSN